MALKSYPSVVTFETVKFSAVMCNRSCDCQ